MIETQLDNLVYNKLTRAQYDQLVADGDVAEDEFYMVTGDDLPKGDKGDTGDTGADGADGTDGQDGADGASAYDIAVDNGYSGSESEWLLSLKGADGAPGQDGEKGDTGDTGPQGEQGVPGADGAPGADFPYEILTQDEYNALTSYENKLYVIVEG